MRYAALLLVLASMLELVSAQNSWLQQPAPLNLKLSDTDRPTHLKFITVNGHSRTGGWTQSNRPTRCGNYAFVRGPAG